MAEVFISVGSNVDPEFHAREAVRLLREKFGKLVISPVYETEAVGFDGDDFLNFVVKFSTDHDVKSLDAVLDDIEESCGRDQDSPRFAPRTLDLDLLLFDDVVMNSGDIRLPRREILKYAFVLAPLADIASGVRHPETGKTFADHWRQFDAGDQRCKRVALEF